MEQTIWEIGFENCLTSNLILSSQLQGQQMSIDHSRLVETHTFQYNKLGGMDCDEYLHLST
jgi:hypothetical protein